MTEKTCHDTMDDGYMFQCSECGYVLIIRDESGYTMWRGALDYLFEPNYCPNCGSKVVEE